MTTTNSLRAAVIGVGHLGQHHARILSSMSGVEFVGVVDQRVDQSQKIAAQFHCRAFSDPADVLDLVDAVVIAVPTRYHRQVATPFLARGVHALIEKPLAINSEQGAALLELARASGAILQVGHIERFNPIFRAARDSGFQPRYINAERLSTYTFRSTDIGIVHDLMIHDLDLVLSLVPAAVRSVSAVGLAVLGELEDIAEARIEFEDGTVASLSASRVSYQPVRKMRLWANEGYMSMDFAAKTATVLRPSEELRRGNLQLQGVDLAVPDRIREHLFGTILEVDHLKRSDREPLALEIEDFLGAIREKRSPLVSGDAGFRALQLADQIVQSIQSHQWEPATSSTLKGPHLPPFRSSSVRDPVASESQSSDNPSRINSRDL